MISNKTKCKRSFAFANSHTGVVPKMISKLEGKFIELWRSHFPEIDLISEYRFLPDRRFRFDFCHLESRVAIEINGGRWVKSGHSSGKGLLRDYEKNNLAVLGQWSLFYLCDDQINLENLGKIASFITDSV